jgi:hypothetical protein
MTETLSTFVSDWAGTGLRSASRGNGNLAREYDVAIPPTCENETMSNVRDFGAKGDGQTDDTKALRHAVDQGGGRLVFPCGTYRLTAPLEIDLDRFGPIALEGDGCTASLRMDGPGPAVRLVGTHYKSADPATIEPRVWRRQRLPTVSNLEIVGNHDQADGIELDGTVQATITGVAIRQCRYGVHLVKRNRNVLLADSHIYDMRSGSIGVYFDGGQSSPDDYLRLPYQFLPACWHQSHPE